jgi:hypothetical protein
MAQKTTVIVDITDDIDGSAGAKTVKFGLDDKTYSIDLNEAHEATLREFLALYIGHAKPTTRTTRKAVKSTSRSIEIREWARKKGIEVSERGRISQSIIDAYDLEHRTSHLTAAPAAPAATDPVSVAMQFTPEPAPAPLAF